MQFGRIIYVSGLLFFLVGCNTATSRYGVKEPVVNTIEDVGSIRVSVLSRAPWAEYKELLQPEFKLSETQALNAAISDSRLQHDQSLSSSLAQLRLSLASKTKSSNTSTNVTDGVTTTSEGETNTRIPGNIDNSVLAPTKDNASQPDIIAAASGKSESLGGVDARLKYQIATSLYQEVKLLSNYIEDAALKSGYTPYVIRLQVTLMPFMRYLPYDAYINLSFFNNHEKRVELNADENSTLGKMPVVIPLFATDSMENTVSSVEIGKIKQLGLAISSLGNTAAGAELSNLKKDIETALGRDTNSLFTIGRMSDNMVRARLGALQQVKVNYAMVPRTETITLLVMVDDKLSKGDAQDRTLHIHTYGDFTHVITGKKPEPISSDRDLQIAKDVFNTFGLLVNEGDVIDYYNTLWNYVLSGNWDSFTKEINKQCEKSNPNCSKERQFIDAEQLWHDIAYYQHAYGVDNLRVEIPRYIPPKMFISQTALLFDDDKSTSKVTVRGGLNLSADNLCGAIVYIKQGPPEEISDLLISSKVTTLNKGRDAIFEFPSLSQLQLDEPVKKGQAQLRLAYTNTDEHCLSEISSEINCHPDKFCSTSLKYLKAKTPEKPDPGFKMAALTGYLVKDANNKGSLNIQFSTLKKNPASKVKVNIVNANLDDVENKSKNSVKLVKNGNNFELFFNKAEEKVTIEIRLKGLAKGEEVLITALDENKGGVPTLKMKVREK